MSSPIAVLLGVILVVAAVNIAFGVIEWFLARGKNKTLGLVLPFSFFVIAVMSMLTSIEKLFLDLVSTETPAAAVIVLIALFLFLNIPTLVTYLVYFRIRRKMGERPWPMKKQSGDPS